MRIIVVLLEFLGISNSLREIPSILSSRNVLMLLISNVTVNYFVFCLTEK